MPANVLHFHINTKWEKIYEHAWGAGIMGGEEMLLRQILEFTMNKLFAFFSGELCFSELIVEVRTAINKGKPEKA